MPGYGQFCPIAQAAEVLTERWKPLVIREMALGGSRRFNDIQRGVPLMSSSLLSKRLRQLELAGIVERRRRADGAGEYHLTLAGEELGPVVAQMGVWSERWLRRPIFEETPDTGILMWWMRGTVRVPEPADRRPLLVRGDPPGRYRASIGPRRGPLHTGNDRKVQESADTARPPVGLFVAFALACRVVPDVIFHDLVN